MPAPTLHAGQLKSSDGIRLTDGTGEDVWVVANGMAAGPAVDNGGAVYNVLHPRFAGGAHGDANFYNPATGRWYVDGAYTTPAHDDTDAILAAIADLPGLSAASAAGGDAATLLIPAGRRYLIRGALTIDRPISLLARGATLVLEGDATHHGIVVARGVGTPGIVYGGEWEFPRIIRPNGSGGRVDWSPGNEAIRLQNLRNARVHFGQLYGFARGIVLDGDEQGTSYNDYYLPRVTNCRVGLEFRHRNTNGGELGWVNESTFFGGKFEVASGAPVDVTGVVHIEMSARGGIASNGPGNCTFIRPTLEGPQLISAVIRCGGNSNIFISPRLEGVPDGRMHFTSTSRGNILIGHDYDPTDPVYLDEGVGNEIRGAWGHSGSSWTTNAAVIAAANLRGDTRPAVGARAMAAGTQNVSVGMCGDGSVLWPLMSPARRMSWSGNNLSLSSGGYAGQWHAFTPVAASSVPNNSMFVDSADGALKFKNASGSVRTI